MGTEPFLINPKRKLKISGLKASGSLRKYAKLKRKTHKTNPLGEEVLILGMNRKRRRRLRKNAWFDDAAGHRKAARKGWRTGHKKAKKHHKLVLTRKSKPRKSKSKHRFSSVVRSGGFGGFRPYGMPLGSNPRRRRSRRHRRNPIALGGVVSQVKSALPMVAVGAVSAIATTMVPKFVPISGQWAKYGSQVATAVVGGLLIGKFLKKEYGTIWMVVGGSVILADLLNKYVVPASMKSLGFGDDEEGQYEFSAFPNVGAFTESVSGIDDVGAYNPYAQATSLY